MLSSSQFVRGIFLPCGGILLLLLTAVPPTTAQTTAQTGQAQEQRIRAAVADWYTTLSGDAMSVMSAYRALAPDLQKHMSLAEFQQLYVDTAHVKLTQMHMGDRDIEKAQVLVEDQRVQTISGIPAMVWYTGFLTLQRVQNSWAVSAFHLHPEDIVGPKYRAEDQWQTDPVRVAERAVGGDAKLCPDKMQSEPGDAQALAVFVCTDKRTVLDMAHLYSGAWVIFRRGEEPLSEKTKGTAPASMEGP